MLSAECTGQVVPAGFEDIRRTDVGIERVVRVSLPRVRCQVAVAGLAVLTGLAGPAAFSIHTALRRIPATIRWPGPAADLTPDSRAIAMLRSGAAKYRWIAATVGGFTATRFQVAAGSPVMAVGGPQGTDPLPSLDQFRRYVGAGDIHYFIAPEMDPGNPNEIGPPAASSSNGSSTAISRS